jgi:hypothetical protein
VWRHLSHSLQGDSHKAEDSPCQDCHSVRILGEGAANTFIACVADGAGSAKYSEEGSAIVCERIVENAAAFFDSCGNFDALQAADVKKWCEDARQTIEASAESRECSTREFATTICAAIISPTRSYFFQIGDGAMILGSEGTYGVVFWPQSGEYANSTNFLTGEKYQEHLEFLAVETQISDLALFTDGIERLALVFECQTPHPPFFEPLFRTLRSTDNPEDLSKDFCRFLQSDSVKARSDDDKTLVLASRVSEEMSRNV